MKRIILVAAGISILLVLFAVPGLPPQSRIVLSASFLAALLGGVISIFSPCSAALLPAFFAYSFQTRTQLVKMTFVFWMGLATVFVPLAFSASLVSRFFLHYRTTVFWGAGIIFILLGLATLAPPRWLTIPHVRLPAGKNAGSVYVMGLLFAFASGTCTAPILGGILTLAATQQTVLTAFFLLLTYSFGLVIPLFLLAYFFERWRLLDTGWIQRNTRWISAVLLLGLGVLFIATKGTNALLLLFTGAGLTDVYFDLNERILFWTRDIPNVIVITALVLVGVIVWYWRKKSIHHP